MQTARIPWIGPRTGGVAQVAPEGHPAGTRCDPSLRVIVEVPGEGPPPSKKRARECTSSVDNEPAQAGTPTAPGNGRGERGSRYLHLDPRERLRRAARILAAGALRAAEAEAAAAKGIGLDDDEHATASLADHEPKSAGSRRREKVGSKG